MGKEAEYTVDIHRVTTDDAGTTDGLYACLECTRMPFELAKEADRLIGILNSHAAHLAKIKALEEAIEGLLTDSNLSAYVSEIEAKPLDEVDEYDARTIQSAESARAALALPSA